MTRRTVYCVIPRALAPELHDYLRHHWRDDPSVVVVVERRGTERRRADRRSQPASTPAHPERRRVPSPSGRRVAERRVMAVTVEPPGLPAKARRHADELVFLERLAPSGRDAEDLDTNRLLVRIQIGDTAAFDPLYLRYFDRVYAYARVALRDAHEAEDVAQQVFANVIQALPRYEVREDAPFRSWLFRITRNAVLRTLSRSGRLQPEEPAELDRRLESPTPEAPMGLNWLSDTDLAILVERLPLTQRQVILLRYVFGFTTDEIASALERTSTAVRMLEHRAMRALEARLAAFRDPSGRRRRSSRSRPVPMMNRHRTAPVLRSRQLALHAPGSRPT